MHNLIFHKQINSKSNWYWNWIFFFLMCVKRFCQLHCNLTSASRLTKKSTIWRLSLSIQIGKNVKRIVHGWAIINENNIRAQRSSLSMLFYSRRSPKNSLLRGIRVKPNVVSMLKWVNTKRGSLGWELFNIQKKKYIDDTEPYEYKYTWISLDGVHFDFAHTTRARL